MLQALNFFSAATHSVFSPARKRDGGRPPGRLGIPSATSLECHYLFSRSGRGLSQSSWKPARVALSSDGRPISTSLLRDSSELGSDAK